MNAATEKMKNGTEVMHTTTELIEGWVRSYASDVYRAAFLVLRNADECEDVVQETFVRAAKAAHRIPAECNIVAWLYTISTNIAKNRVRSLVREREAVARIPIESEMPTDDVATRLDVRDAVRALPASLMQAVVLRYWCQLSETEMARALGVRPGTVKSRLHTARLRLAGELG